MSDCEVRPSLGGLVNDPQFVYVLHNLLDKFISASQKVYAYMPSESSGHDDATVVVLEVTSQHMCEDLAAQSERQALDLGRTESCLELFDHREVTIPANTSIEHAARSGGPALASTPVNGCYSLLQL